MIEQFVQNYLANHRKDNDVHGLFGVLSFTVLSSHDDGHNTDLDSHMQ
jgi:hypothetical protein